MEQRYQIWTAIVLYALVFVLFILFAQPAFYSKEDAYAAYLLAGGFGSPSSVLLHYNYLMHPFLNSAISLFFHLDASVNWYTVFIYFSHFIAGAITLVILMQYFQKIAAAAIFFLIFLVFECWLMMRPGFNSASITITIAGLFLLYFGSSQIRTSQRIIAAAIVLLLLASFFRVHVMLPIFGISLPFFLFNTGRNARLLRVTMLAGVAALVFVFHIIHEQWYARQIPGWEKKDAYCQRVYALYNENRTRGYTGTLYTNELAMLRIGMPADSSYISSEKLNKLKEEIRKVNATPSHFSDVLYWFVVNNRLYLIAGLLVLLLVLPHTKNQLAVVASFACMGGGLYYLAAVAKINPYLVVSSLHVFCLFSVAQISMERVDRWRYRVVVACFIFGGWGVIRTYKTGIINIAQQEKFFAGYRLIGMQKQCLFINTSGEFPWEAIPVHISPARYPLINFLDSDHFLLGLDAVILERYGIANFRSLPASPQVFFLGDPPAALLYYFTKINVKPVQVTQSAGNNTLKIFTIRFQ